MTSPRRSALVIGAGIAGIACATGLARAGVAVTLLDKGRRPGGRVATRRVGEVKFNHGAQFASVRGTDFGAVVDELRHAGLAAPWPAAGHDGRRMVFLPGMSALPGAMADRAATLGVALEAGRHAAFLHPAAPGWRVRHLPAAAIRPGATAATGGTVSGLHDAVLIALPAPQAAALLATASHAFAGMAARAALAPCWAVMARFPDPVPGPDVIEDRDGTIAWAAREGSRPGSAAPPDAWTLHAGAGWSRAHLEDEADAVGRELIAAFRANTGAGAPILMATHRWRHALVETALDVPCLWDPAARLGACGDWCLGGRIEAAHASGISLARTVLADGVP